MRTVALLLLTISLGLRAYAQTGSIHGRVIDQDGKPLADVTISIDRLRFNHHFETKSNSHGTYTHMGLPTGQYELSITKDGKSAKLNTRVTFGNTSTVDFDLRQLLPYDREHRHRVTVAGLTVPRKAQAEWQKAYDARDDWEKAKRHLEKAIEIAPNFEEALNDLGTVYHRKKQYAQAVALFERALKVNPDSVTARVNLGGSLIGLEQYERALSENLRVLARRPDDVLAHSQAGLSLFNVKRYEEAIPHFQQAKQSDPNSAMLPGFLLAYIFDLLGRDEAAIAEYEEFLQTHPRYPGRGEIESRVHDLKSRNSLR
jgi:tetratricopeptide (TPR) repeat protein